MNLNIVAWLAIGSYMTASVLAGANPVLTKHGFYLGEGRGVCIFLAFFALGVAYLWLNRHKLRSP